MGKRVVSCEFGEAEWWWGWREGHLGLCRGREMISIVVILSHLEKNRKEFIGRKRFNLIDSIWYWIGLDGNRIGIGYGMPTRFVILS